MTVASGVCVVEDSSETSIKLVVPVHGMEIMKFEGLKKNWVDAQNMTLEQGLQWRLPSVSDAEKIEQTDPKSISYEFWTSTDYPSLDEQGMYVKKLGSEKRPEWRGNSTGVVLVRNI